MVVYQLTWMDLERGKIVRWRSNKRDIVKLKRDWKEKFPLRKLLLTERVTIPESKPEFMEWLNNNIGG